MAKVSRKDLERALVEADHPATKDQLLEQAERQGADEDVHKALRSLQPVEYRSLDEVVASVHTDVAGGG